VHPLQPVTAIRYKPNTFQKKSISHRKQPSKAAEENIKHPAPDSMTISAVPDMSLEERSRTFTLFPKLPPELRLKIWKMSTQHTRIVKWIYGHVSMDFVIEEGVTQGQYAFRSQCTETIPSVLRATCESRAAALESYTLCLESQFLHPIYFNYDQDIFVFSHEHGPWHFEMNVPYRSKYAEHKESFYANLRHLVVCDSVGMSGMELVSYRKFCNLKLLVLPHIVCESIAPLAGPNTGREDLEKCSQGKASRVLEFSTFTQISTFLFWANLQR
jgi:hypothetical protein